MAASIATLPLPYGRTGETAVHAQSAGLIVPGDRAGWTELDRHPFAFRHGLAHHPLFSLARLARVAEQVALAGDADRYLYANEPHLAPRELQRRLREAVEQIDSKPCWLKLSFVDRIDPDYADLLDQLLADIEAASGVAVRQRMTWAGMTVFLNSPGLQVPYHFDHETNFLLQIAGEKKLWLYPNDRSVVTDEEIEHFYSHYPMAARYREEVADTGVEFLLTPGIAVHHPPLAPHRISNGDRVSISLSLYYTLPPTEYRARVYQANYCMRRLGLHPRPPGESAWRDAAKNRLIQWVSNRHPSNYDALLYSGVERLGAPLRAVKRLTRRVMSS